MVTFEKPFIINIKYNFTIINLKDKKQKGRHQTRIEPKQAYNKKLPIEKAKINDLLSLCEMDLVPLIYHAFYKSLYSK